MSAMLVELTQADVGEPRTPRPGDRLNFRGANTNLRLTERFTRVGPDTLLYEFTAEDPTTWTQPWTVRQEMTAQDEQANRIYYEPRCHEGNFGMSGMLINSRSEERDFALGRGPDPATRDNATGGAGGGEANTDPLAAGN